ncbi:hypothetical protein HELRODRAFT_166988 [Helobdella robusta]|uniref:Uncharacterized protein n=1 Tax=Helobdella robusta TaxID=6412 RepID=T1EYU8_HELRO|nr:hypothetical protein HELRODRAFT_166988 [Helobdella robusta]ESO11898.1 hypothetical protein HELRODRAFT_166988 [Helobdella robusta]
MDNDRVRSLVVESITSLCCSEFKFKDRLKVEGLLGITIDEVEVFLVSFNETFIHGNHAMAAVVGSEFFDSELLKNQHSNLPSISQQIPGLNENALALMAAKKQKLDLSDLQNMTQFLTSASQQDQVNNNNDMDGVIICDGDTLSQSDLENASNLADMSQNDNSTNWSIPFNKILPSQQQQQQQQINLEKEKEKVMAAALAAMRQQQFLQQTPDQTLVTVNNVAALQQQLRNNYLAVQQQQNERDDQSIATTLEQIQYDTQALEQSVAVASAALQQRFAINMADQTGLGLLSNKALVSGLILDQLQQHCVVDEEGQQQVAQAAQALFHRHQGNQLNQSQADDDPSIDSKKNASLLQALSGAANSLNVNASHHLVKQQQLRQNDQAEALILHLKQGGSSGNATDVLNNNNNNNNLLENSGQTSNDDDDDNVDSKLWMSSANNDIISNAPPVYSGLLATASSASSSSTSPSPTWLAHHQANQQQTMKISPGGGIENHLFGIFSSALKTFKVILLFKKGCQMDINNY